MQLEQQFELAVSPDRAWPAFRDVTLMVECLPGASLTGEPADGEVPLRFDVKLGPVAVGFVGSGRLSLDEPARSGRFEGAAGDRRTQSRVKGAAAFELLPAAEGGGSLVKVAIDYALSGTLAQIGRPGIVREVASALTAQFAANLSTRLSAMPVVGADDSAPDGSDLRGAGLHRAGDAAPLAAGVAVLGTAGEGGSVPWPASAPIASVAPDPETATPDRAARPPSPATALPESASPPPRPVVAPLSAGSLLASMLGARLRRLLDRILGRSSA